MEFFQGTLVILIFLAFGLILLWFSIRRKSKYGIALSVIILLMLFLSLFFNNRNSPPLDKGSIIASLNLLDLTPEDDFHIISLNTADRNMQSGILLISNQDKQRLARKIRGASDFQFFDTYEALPPRYTEEKNVMFNYLRDGMFVRGAFTDILKTPTRLFAAITVDGDTLKFSRYINPD